jgi:hypothetical protein
MSSIESNGDAASFDFRSPSVRAWANNTLACGLLGAAVGAANGAFSGSGARPMAISLSASALVLGGTFLALREAVVSFSPPLLGPTGASAIAAAVVGGASAARLSGLARAPAPALISACLAVTGQMGVDNFDAWRKREAARITRQRQLMGHLSSAEEAEWARIQAAVRDGGLRRSEMEKSPYEAIIEAARRARGDPESEDGVAPRAPTLEAFVARIRAARGEVPDGPAARQSSPKISSAEAAPAPTPATRGFLAWFPVSIDADASDARRLTKARERLDEVEFTLGLRHPAVDERIKALAERERIALAKLGEKPEAR